MFHFDCTMEDVRIIAVEHRVPVDAQELIFLTRTNLERVNEGKLPIPLDKHDGTFDVKHVDALTGATHTLNLTTKELAVVMNLGISGGEGDDNLYETDEVRRYQVLMKDHEQLSFIP